MGGILLDKGATPSSSNFATHRKPCPPPQIKRGSRNRSITAARPVWTHGGEGENQDGDRTSDERFEMMADNDHWEDERNEMTSSLAVVQSSLEGSLESLDEYV